MSIVVIVTYVVVNVVYVAVVICVDIVPVSVPAGV